MGMTDLHTCSYYCNRPECIKAQRDELRERLAQPQQSHEINADTDAIGMAIHDALVCGTGVVKLWLDAGKMTFDHVSIKDFAVFGDELKRRAAHTGKEKMND
jgi:hypothetical protein